MCVAVIKAYKTSTEIIRQLNFSMLLRFIVPLKRIGNTKVLTNQLISSM